MTDLQSLTAVLAGVILCGASELRLWAQKRTRLSRRVAAVRPKQR